MKSNGNYCSFTGLFMLSFLLIAALPSGLLAAMDSHIASMTVEQQRDMFLEKKEIDGYAVSFHVMKVDPGMEHGGSHNFMVKIEKDGLPQHDVVINSKVILADGKVQSKPLMKMGDWFMGGYDLDAPGRHQLLILFKTADGLKHKGGVLYQVTTK